jgi:hypothetical protein
MKYIPKQVNFKDWKTASKTMDENQKLLDEIDKKAKEDGGLLWRYIQEPVADGYAVYQITRVNKNSVRIVHCTGLGDDYFVNYWGEEATIDLDYANMLVSHRDYLGTLFASKGN